MDPKQDKIKPKVIQTFAEDMAGALEESSGGEIKKIIHGEEQREKEKQNLSPQALKNRLFMLFGFIFIFAAVALLAFFLTHREPATVSVAPQFVPLLFTDQSQFLEVTDLNKDQIALAIRSEMNSSKLKEGGVEAIYLTENKKVIGLARFLALIKSEFAPKPEYVEDNFLTGFVNNVSPARPGGRDFFILLKMRSIADIFGAMQAWEGKMFSDLHGFFNIAISTESEPLLSTDFKDGIIENKNARILYDPRGNVAMMYVFPDDNSVIITNTREAVEEIIVRLAQNQIKKY